MQTLLTTSIIQQYAQADNRTQAFYDLNNGNLESSTLMSIFALNWAQRRFSTPSSNETESFFTSLGYQIGGPVCWLFANFVNENVKKSQYGRVAFIARDGFTL